MHAYTLLETMLKQEINPASMYAVSLPEIAPRGYRHIGPYARSVRADTESSTWYVMPGVGSKQHAVEQYGHRQIADGRRQIAELTTALCGSGSTIRCRLVPDMA
eukprot:2968852-Rhodomonas_salina.1